MNTLHRKQITTQNKEEKEEEKIMEIRKKQRM
jgi:hypothetical protein